MGAKMQLIDEATPAAVAAGVRQFQAFLSGEDDAQHASRLLALMDPPAEAIVIDAGCGIGETARLMRAERPDLQFLLVNLSAAQLAMCPADMPRVRADFRSMPVADGSADVVFYSYSASHCNDWTTMLDEARRVLKHDGQVFIHDLADVGGADRDAWRSIGSIARSVDEMARMARMAGFDVEDALILESRVDQLRCLVSDDDHERLARGIASFVMRLTPIHDPVAQVFARHDRIAFQFSGGRDSTAALFLLRDWWPRMTVYHVDTGDQFPETREIVAVIESAVKESGGRFERVCTDVRAARALHGLPTDVLPVDNHETIGMNVSGRSLKLQSRYECCMRSLMMPLHERMVADNITLIVRGQRDDEYAEPPLRDGAVARGIEFLYPIQSWGAGDVDRFISDNDLPVGRWYELGAPHGSDCMGCTAWWDDGRVTYMKKFHPVDYATLRANLASIRGEINRQMSWLDVMES